MNVPHRSVPVRVSRRFFRRPFTHLIALIVAIGVALSTAALPSTAAPEAGPTAAQLRAEDGTLRVLLFFKPNFHASHVEARQAVRELTTELSAEYGQTVEIEETDNAAAFTAENLATHDAVAFAQTGGVLFNAAQREALEDYIRGGGGYVGLHYAGWSVGESEHDVNPFYAKLVGAVSEGHPENPAVRPGKVVVKDASHPLTEGLPADFTRSDEWYDWVVNPAQNVRTLLEADESSYGMGRQGSSHPITWCQQIDEGRSWYSGMGHEGSAYSEPTIRTQLRNGLAYAAGLLPADCSPPSKAEHGAWSDVTPWPLMPINMALTSDGKVQSFGSVGGWGNDTTPYDWTGDSSITQGGQMEVDLWNPEVPRTLANVRHGILPNTTYTDLFCSMQVQNPHNHSTMTVGGDDSLGGNAPNDAAIGVTSYTTNNGLQNEAPMNYPRWYPTGTTMPNGDVVVQGGSLRGGPGGPGVLTPEIYTPNEGSGWKKLTGAKSSAAYGDGGSDHPGQDENRWWYPRAFVTPGSGNLFNITGTQMYDLDPSGDGEITLRGTLPGAIANQGALGNPVGATSTATMYRPGKILQVGGGWWANGGGPAGARAGFTVDITGGTENPVIEATEPMKHQRHWATSTVLPDGDVLVTGGSRDNNGNGSYVTNAETWNPDTGTWTTVESPHAHARLYHSAALLLPDGRVMIGGGGAPGPRNYTDVEYYSPAYLFDGDEKAERPELTDVPGKIGYDGTFDVKASSDVSRVTLVRNGSVTHGFNNDQNFQDLEFTQAGSGEVTITAPSDGTYAPPGAYMLFVFDEDGTPSVASILKIDPEVPMEHRTPQVVDQFEYPRVPTEWRSGNPPAVIDVASGNGRMAPWAVDGAVQLTRGTTGSNGGLGLTGYHLALGDSGSLERRIEGLDPGREYRVSLRYARDSRDTGSDPASATLKVGSLDTTVTATTDTPSRTKFDTAVETFTASKRSEILSLATSGSGPGLVIDDLVVASVGAGLDDAPIRYAFEEGEGASAANTGSNTSVGAATLTGSTGWAEQGVFGSGIELPGGNRENAVDLPDNLLRDAASFSTSLWVNPDELSDWTGLLHIGNGEDGFFQIQTRTQADGPTGLAATFKAPGAALQERVRGTAATDLVANQWNHVVFTRDGATGTLYLNGEEIASADDLTIDMADIGSTVDNWLGRNGFPDDALDGTMDDVRLYTSALSASDVDALYADGSALRTTTTLSVDPVSPSPFGEPLTVDATVKAGDQPADGNVELWVDEARVGDAVALDDGAATFPELTLGRGDHEIEVRYLAADGWRDSRASVTHTVERPPPGEGVPIHYTFDEGQGTTAANTGSDSSVGAATFSGSTSWTQNGQFGPGVSLPGGGSGTGNHVRLPNNIDAGMDEEFTVSMWARPDALPNWVPLLQIGSSTDTFFLLQSATQAAGPSGFAATFKAPGNATQERLTLGGDNDLPLDKWTHVVFTMSGSTGKIYFDGELQGTRTDFTLGIGDVGVGGDTTANFIGGTSWPDPRFDGLVDDFRMYDYELTEGQVTDLFEGSPENRAPVGTADAYDVDQDEVLTVEAPGVLDNDTDADGDPLTATDLTQPTDGEVALDEDGSFTYTPDEGFHGEDTFTYRAHDGALKSAPVTVTVTVEEAAPPVNQAPLGSDDAYETDKGKVLRVAAPGVLANDSDPDGDELTVAGVTQPDGGAVVVRPDGSVTYTPDDEFHGEDTFTYRANDGSVDSEPVTVTIIVVDTSDDPTPTAIVGSSATYTYGKRGVVSVAVIPGAATGQVQLVRGSTVVASGQLSDGKAMVILPAKSLKPATYGLTLRYVGSDTHETSKTTVRVVVKKVAPSIKVRASKKVKRGARAKVRVTLSAADKVAVTGKVRLRVQGRNITRTVKKGKVTFTLPKAKRAGSMRVRVTYLGSALANKKVTNLRISVRGLG